jgi:tight adherence protein B
VTTAALLPAHPLVGGAAAALLVLHLGGLSRVPIAPRCRPVAPPVATLAAAPHDRRVHRRRQLFGRRASPPTDGDVAAWCDDIARRVRSGDTLTTAVLDARASPALARELHPVRLAVERGALLAEAVHRSGHPPNPLGLAYGVLQACATLGGPAAEPLDRVAATLRARVADQADRWTQSAQVRLSSLVLTVVPFGTLAFLLAVAPPIRATVVTPAGLGCAAAGSALNVIGWGWMRRIVEAAGR